MTTQRLAGVEIQVIESLRSSLCPSAEPFDETSYLSKSINPALHDSALSYKKSAAYYSLLRKWKGFSSNGRLARTWASWLEAEKQCFRTNRRLNTEAATGCYSVAPRVISEAQRKVSSVLGPLNFDRIVELCRFGPGATSDLKRAEATLTGKSCKPSVTFDAIPWVCRSLSGDDYLGSLVGPFRDLNITRANRMVTVPKTSLIDRMIAAEPTLNSYVQQGVGRFIRGRLKRAGVDLDDQTINQDLASRAKLEGLATLDLSMASDTLSVNLVKLLVPGDWFEMLDDIRCKFSTFHGKTFALSKFSSMGNAFTFELESLLFWSLVSSSCKGDVCSVYGDDLIVCDTDYEEVLRTLSWAGFTVNQEKSYAQGSRFFESCGKHYFDGVEVTPPFQKDVCRTPHDFVHFHNRLIRAGIRLDLRDEFEAAAALVRRCAKSIFGLNTPGVGPMVEYDEYFIREDYVWPDQIVDRVRIKSALNRLVLDRPGAIAQIAHLARKLRSPSSLNAHPKGWVSDRSWIELVVRNKYHWRSSSS